MLLAGFVVVDRLGELQRLAELLRGAAQPVLGALFQLLAPLGQVRRFLPDGLPLALHLGPSTRHRRFFGDQLAGQLGQPGAFRVDLAGAFVERRATNWTPGFLVKTEKPTDVWLPQAP